MPKQRFVLPGGVSIGETLAIMSSKGGVGKSTVTALLASVLAKKGFNVGVLDADIIGPTLSEAFGVKDRLVADQNGLLPGITSTGIKIVSSQMLLDQTSDPIMWRAPLVVDLIRQFYVDIHWGHLDYLLIDMPPGTGDVSLTVLESLNVNHILMVTSPQDIVSRIVEKGIEMAKAVKIPLFGVIENYSYFICDQCEKKHYMFGAEHTKSFLEKRSIRFLGQLPIDKSIATAMDHGKIESIEQPVIQTLVELLIGKNL
jgi:Mrp family chromosome partitioning ATPase